MALNLGAQHVLIFTLVRLSAPVPWLSGRASASHAEGRWFDPSRDHQRQCWSQDFPVSDFRSLANSSPDYRPFIRCHGHPPSPPSASATRSRSES
jgi:hypothetical protein